MTLIKTSILSFIATAVKMLAGLVINKAVAVYVGPSGLAIIGQFQNFIQLTMTAAQGAINTGLTKYAAEYGKNSDKIPILFSTASRISLITSVFVGGVIIVFSKFISAKLLYTDQYSYILVIFGFTIILFVVNSFLLAVLNGFKEIKTWVSINIIQSVYALIFTTLLVILLGLEGALISLVTNQSVVLIIVLWMLRKHDVIKLANFKEKFNRPEAKRLSGYALMAITSAIMVPLSHLILRNFINNELGLDQAGYWQAIWYISSMYLMVLTSTLSIYYLPKLSEISDKKELRKELLFGYKVILPIAIFMALIIFILKDFIIWLLFSEEFSPVKELFMWQLVGDVIKIASWLLAYLMLAKARIRAFIITEVLFSGLFLGLAISFISVFGLIGVTYAFALNYLFYFVTVYFIVRSEFSVQ